MSKQQPIYLDYAATTPAAPEVAEAMAACLTADGLFANPASDHTLGRLAEKAVRRASEALAGFIRCAPDELVFTSGATESNNLALKGAFEFYGARIEAAGGRPHLITSKLEHKAVLDVADWLEQRGVSVTRLDVNSQGLVNPADVAAALTEDTVLVSIQQVNNELGCIQPIAEIAALLSDHSARLHVDAAQSVAKIPLNVAELGVDYLSLSAHKFYGPKGIGALYLRSQPRARLRAQQQGGLQQRGLRSGTLPVHQIVGLGKAAEIAANGLPAEVERIAGLRQNLEQGLKKLDGVTINGEGAPRVAGICNVSFAGIAGSSLRAALPDLMLSSGSACTSDNGEPSYVLRALGHDDRLAEASLRISLGRYSNEADVALALQQISDAVEQLRSVSPWWQAAFDAPIAVNKASPAWGDELALFLWPENSMQSGAQSLRWQAAGRPELLQMMPLAAEFYQQNQTVEGLLEQLESAVQISSSNRYLLLLVEDAFKELMDQI